MGLEVLTPIILVSSNTSVPYRSGMVVIQPNRFMFLEKSFEAIQRNVHETDPTDYDKTMSSDDVILWQRAIEEELESIYFNKVWDLIETHERIKLIGCK